MRRYRQQRAENTIRKHRSAGHDGMRETDGDDRRNKTMM